MKERQLPTIINTWTQAFEIMVACKHPLIRILGIAVVLPCLVNFFISGAHSQAVVKHIQSHTHENHLSILNPGANYFLDFIGLNIVTFGSLTLAFVAAVIVAASYFREEIVQARMAFKQSVGMTFPHGLIVTVFACLMSLERVFLGPFKIFTLFSLMAVVIIVHEKKTGFSALKKALLFRYSSPINGGSLSAAFVIIGLGALVFACEYLLELVSNLILFGDEHLLVSRDFWAANIADWLPFTAFQAIAGLINALGLSFLLALVACYLVALYARVRPRITTPV